MKHRRIATILVLTTPLSFGLSTPAPRDREISPPLKTLTLPRRGFLALGVLAVPLSASAAADPRATVILHLESPQQRAGLELIETSIGTPPRPVVAIKNVLPKGVASRNAMIQPGMLIKGYPDANTVTERIKNGPYPIDLQIYNLAAGGDAYGDMGKPIVTAQDALQLARDTKGEGTTPVAQEYSIRVTNPAPASCGMKSRRGDVLEINYEARYGSNNGVMYDSSAQRGTGQPYQFVLGSGDMIPGVDQGLYDMCPGESRDLEIPPMLAYGDRGSKLFEIPGGKRLFWSVQLVRLNSVGEGDDRTRDEIEGRFVY